MIVVFRWPPGKNKFFRSDILQGKFLFKRFHPYTHNLEHLQKIKKKKKKKELMAEIWMAYPMYNSEPVDVFHSSKQL